MSLFIALFYRSCDCNLLWICVRFYLVGACRLHVFISCIMSRCSLYRFVACARLTCVGRILYVSFALCSFPRCSACCLSHNRLCNASLCLCLMSLHRRCLRCLRYPRLRRLTLQLLQSGCPMVVERTPSSLSFCMSFGCTDRLPCIPALHCLHTMGVAPQYQQDLVFSQPNPSYMNFTPCLTIRHVLRCQSYQL
jgi:hypothetical protein